MHCLYIMGLFVLKGATSFRCAKDFSVRPPEMAEGFRNVKLDRSLVDVHSIGDLSICQILCQTKTDSFPAAIREPLDMMEQLRMNHFWIALAVLFLRVVHFFKQAVVLGKFSLYIPMTEIPNNHITNRCEEIMA
jgi:hypothetical protein